MTNTPSIFPNDLRKPVCVFCGSSPGSTAIYADSAQSVGEALAKARIPVVYGGGRRGIMGVVSQSTLKAGGYVHGILPRALLGRATEHTPTPGAGATVSDPAAAVSVEGKGHDLLADDFGGRLTMEVVGSMHERKFKMAKVSTGGFVVLPGGYGTFEELMEMVTWKQIGMHSLPVIVLNIGNFYEPMRVLINQAVEAGFIAPTNLSLVTIVDLPGGAAANADESKTAEWGPAAVKALEDWSLPANAGYGFKWDVSKEARPDQAEQGAAVSAVSTHAEPSLVSNAPPPQPALFTTGRFTVTATTAPVSPARVPLWERHVARLRAAHAHFAEAEDAVWGTWPGDDAVWAAVGPELEKREAEGEGDWRLRILVRPGPKIEVQTIATKGIPPFNPLPSPTPGPRRRLHLDPEASVIPDPERKYRLFKTEHRKFYDAASERVGGAHAEVLMHTASGASGASEANTEANTETRGTEPSTRPPPTNTLLETNTSNIALLTPHGWLTPRLEYASPFLAGTMRAELLAAGVVAEAHLTVADWRRAKAEGWRVVGFNGFRGVWEAELV